MENIINLITAEKSLTVINKGLSLIDKKYGEVGPACNAVSLFLASDTGKAELKAAGVSSKAWLTSKLTVSVNAFYNAVRRYKDGLLTEEEKAAKKAKADKTKADNKAEKEKGDNAAISPEFGKVELALPEFLKRLDDNQFSTFKAAVDAEYNRREEIKTAEAATIAKKADKKAA